MDKTIRRVTDPIEQELETLRYWQSRSVGERLVAVCELERSRLFFEGGFQRSLQAMMTKDLKDLLRIFNANAVKYLTRTDPT